MIKKNKKLNFISQSILLVFFASVSFPILSSSAMESETFIMEKDVVGSFGLESSSENYDLQDTGGESLVGDTDSDGFNLDSGFWSGADSESHEIVSVNAPNNLDAKIQSNSEIKLEWADNSDNEEGFEIERRKDGENFELIYTSTTNDTEYIDDNFDPETKYYYRVRSFSGEIYSDYSNEDDVTTGISEIDIDSLRGFCDYMEIDVSIDSHYGDESLDFRVNINNVDNGSESRVEIENQKANSSGEVSLEINSLKRDSLYEVRVSFKGSGDYSSWSNKRDIATSGCTLDPADPPVIIIEPDDPLVIPADLDDPKSEEDESDEKPDKKNESVVGGLTESVIGGAKKIQKIAKENKGAITATSVATIPLLTLSLLAQLQSFSNLGALIRSILSFFTGFFSTKRKNWGTVFDSKTGKPISLATVSIFNERDREVDSRVTDKLGAYSFLVSPGEYYLEVMKRGYEIDNASNSKDVLYLDQYDGKKITVNEYDIVKKDIPMERQEEAYQKDFKKLKVKKAFSYTFLIIGIILSFGALAIDQTILNFSVCLIYVLSVFLSYRMMISSIKWGLILGEGGKIEAFAIIKVTDRNTGEKKMRTVSDEKGRFFIILDPGDYKMEISGVSGLKGEIEFSLKKRSVFKKKIKLSN